MDYVIIYNSWGKNLSKLDLTSNWANPRIDKKTNIYWVTRMCSICNAFCLFIGMVYFHINPEISQRDYLIILHE